MTANNDPSNEARNAVIFYLAVSLLLLGVAFAVRWYNSYFLITMTIIERINANLEVAYESLKLSKNGVKVFKGRSDWKERVEGDKKTIEVLTKLKEKYK